MFLSNLDIISPRLTLYYQKKSSHTSKVGGLLTITAYTVILAIIIYFSLDIVCHQNPTAFYFNKFVEDAGFFPLNSSSMFHFFQMSLVNNEVDVVDFDAISIIGLQELIGTYIENNEIEKYDHWIYGNCDKAKDAQGLTDLLNFKNFEQSGCIKKFFNHTTQKYYETNEKGFIYPSIEKGCSHPNRTFYGIIIEKCRNNSLRNMPCKTNEEINNYISTHVGLEMQIIDQFIDVTNYKTPYTKYFYKITNGLFSESFSTNHLNFNPSTIKTHNGLMFDNIEENRAYVFEQNEKITQETKNTGIYCAFYFWMQNRMQLYERSYKRLQDVIASAGGTTKLITLIASILNFIYNRFIVLLDTQETMSSFSFGISEQKTDNDKTLPSQQCVSNNYIQTPSTHLRRINLKPINSAKSINTSSFKKKYQKLKISFIQYLFNFLKIRNKNKNIEMYEFFRMKVCSEEQLFKNYLDIYTLLKFKEKEKEKDRSMFEEYELTEIIKEIK